jgi:hypothetical protein
MTAKRISPTFLVRMLGSDVALSKIPIRVVSTALSAVQDLASGRDPMETRQVPEEKVISLVNVSKGSAIYSCVSRAPEEARHNLRVVGRLLTESHSQTPESSEENLARTLKPIEKLSEVAKSIDCKIEVSLVGSREPLFVVQRDDFAKLSRKLFLEGETTIIGTVKRVGGQTGMKCALSVPGRAH